MINMYAFTYIGAMKKYSEAGYMLVKVGDSTRDPMIRIKEQGTSAEYQEKVIIGLWPALTKIDRDYRVHEVLTSRGLHNQEGLGTEWFKIPANTVTEAYNYIDNVITSLEGRKVRKSLKLRALQEQKLNQAMDIIDACVADGKDASSIIANLCPRFGKTIWALALFNRISEKYNNRVMLLPAYWLSVHTSFINELDDYDEFTGMREINPDDKDAAMLAQEYLNEGLRIVVPVSLHGDLAEWSEKHKWIADINNDDIFIFADEGDFGTHTENQVAKLQFLFDN